MTMFYNAFNRVEEVGGGGGTAPDNYVKLDIKCHAAAMAGKSLDIKLRQAVCQPQQHTLCTAKLASVLSADGYYHVAGDVYITQIGCYEVSIHGEYAISEIFVSTIDNSTVQLVVYPTLYGLFNRGGNGVYNYTDVTVKPIQTMRSGTYTDKSNTLSTLDLALMFNDAITYSGSSLQARLALKILDAPDKSGTPHAFARTGGLHIYSDAFNNRPVKAVTFLTIAGMHPDSRSSTDQIAPAMYDIQPAHPWLRRTRYCTKAALVGIDSNGGTHLLGKTIMSRSTPYESLLFTNISYNYNYDTMAPITIDCADNDTAYESYVLLYSDESSDASEDYIAMHSVQLFTDSQYSTEVSAYDSCYELGGSVATLKNIYKDGSGATLILSRGAYSPLYHPFRLRGFTSTITTTPASEHIGVYDCSDAYAASELCNVTAKRANYLISDATFGDDGVATAGDLTIGAGNTGTPSALIRAYNITRSDGVDTSTRVTVKKTKLVGDSCYLGYHRSHGDTRL